MPNVSMQSVQRGVAAYLDNEFMPAFPEKGIQRILVGAAASLAIKRYSDLVEVYKEQPFVKSLGIFDENGDVDIDTLAGAVKGQMGKDGFSVDIPALGTLTFKTMDVDKLCDYIHKA